MLPTDLLALVSHRGRSYHNEAWTRERISTQETPANPLGTALDQLLGFARGRSVWVSVHRQRLQGLVGARQRGGRQAWEIDYLVDGTRGYDAVPGLLDSAIADAGRAGAEKLFLRLESSCPLLPVVLETGFLPYQESTLYRRPGNLTPSEIGGLRNLAAMDSYFIFRLYSACTPEPVRRMEAATFAEWQAAQDRRWLKHGVQLVIEREGSVAGCVSAAPNASGISIDLLVEQSAGDQVLPLVGAACSALDAPFASVEVLVPSTADGTARCLQEAGFEAQREFVSLMRRTTRPIAVPNLRPAIAKNAVGV
ncbi:MAG: hypothetical protein AB7P33_01440 [Dehalococcoidia bacterium]